jgi:protein SCO1
MAKILLLLIPLAVLTMTGCPTKSSSPVAGRAYVENADGSRVLASEQTSRKKTPPKKPAGSDKAWLEQFELTERSGATVTSAELKGQPYVVSFFFSTCPTICTRQNEKVALLQQKFKGQPLRLVSITCDPEVDQPEVLQLYAKKFNADPKQWLFLTGELPYLRRVAAELYFVALDRRFHAEKFILVDSNGAIYSVYDWNDAKQYEELQVDIQAMLAAGGSLPKKAEPEPTPVDPDEN